MATARNTLLQQVLSLFENAADENAEKTVSSLLLQYRVQTKPGTVIPDDLTARDALGQKILEIWRSSATDRETQVSTIIDTFRMQLKQKTSKKKTSGATKKAKDTKKARPASMPAELMKATVASSQRRKESTPRTNAVAGGPPRRKRRRSECPKCHSMGVVLAQSYSGDDYYSCVYCGWQAYIPADENDPNASIASRLLGHVSNEK